MSLFMLWRKTGRIVDMVDDETQTLEEGKHDPAIPRTVWMRHVQGSDLHQRSCEFLLLLVKFRQVFSVPSVGAFARSVLRALIDPNPLVVSLWKHISSLLHLAASDYWRDWLWCGDELWWSILDRVTWYWKGSGYPGIQINRVQTSRTWIKRQILKRGSGARGVLLTEHFNLNDDWRSDKIWFGSADDTSGANRESSDGHSTADRNNEANTETLLLTF